MEAQQQALVKGLTRQLNNVILHYKGYVRMPVLDVLKSASGFIDMRPCSMIISSVSRCRSRR